jgi:hypothetical protein
MKNAHICRNHYGMKTEHCLLVEKDWLKKVIQAAAAVVILLTIYFLI